jgi:hypothetical protein
MILPETVTLLKKNQFNCAVSTGNFGCREPVDEAKRLAAGDSVCGRKPWAHEARGGEYGVDAAVWQEPLRQCMNQTPGREILFVTVAMRLSSVRGPESNP